MKKNNLFFFMIILILLNSCSFQNGETNLFVRVKVSSEYNKDIDFKVYLENEAGQAVNCAVVTVVSDSGISSILEFNNTFQCYCGSVNGIDKDEYKIIVKSNLMKGYYTMKIPHLRLSEKPYVLIFNDSEGNSVLSGKPVNKNKQVQIAWNEIDDEDVVYQVIVKDSMNVKWQASVKSNNVIIPAGTFESGTYYLSIKAQKAYGDILFATENYYSVSNCSGSSISFCVE